MVNVAAVKLSAVVVLVDAWDVQEDVRQAVPAAWQHVKAVLQLYLNKAIFFRRCHSIRY